MMPINAQYATFSLTQVVEQVFATRRITRADQQRFMMAAFTAQALSFDEQIQVNRVFDALQRGLIKVVD